MTRSVSKPIHVNQINWWVQVCVAWGLPAVEDRPAYLRVQRRLWEQLQR